MWRGTLVECGPVDQVLRAPVHPHTQELLRHRLTVARGSQPETPRR
jgi:ABC-type dipeptide/oligopeptide/nickel transport system ATPase component